MSESPFPWMRCAVCGECFAPEKLFVETPAAGGRVLCFAHAGAMTWLDAAKFGEDRTQYTK